MRRVPLNRMLVVMLALTLSLSGAVVLATPAEASVTTQDGTMQRYVVVFKNGATSAGVRAVVQAGGTVVSVNKLGIARVQSDKGAFLGALGTSGAVEEIGSDAYWRQARAQVVAAPPPVPGPEIATGCAGQYATPGGTGIGPDPLSVCQWDMRIINASPTGSYAVNQGQGATVGIMDTGVDLTHPDIAPNLSVALSCSFIRPTTPTSLPAEWETTDTCATKSAVQDYAGHGTHVAGTVAAPINGIGVAGVAPRATIVGLKAGTAEGYFFTQEVVDALIYAGDKQLDVVNMSFFADPYLFNCKNDATQRAIVKAISRAAQYAAQQGVVLVAAAGNETTDLDHPTTDEISPDYPPGSETPREVGNNCVVLPGELPWVATISSIGPRKTLAFYSNYSNSKVDVTAPGGSSLQAPNPYGRVLNAWSSTAPPVSQTAQRRMVEECQTVGGAPVCAMYGWIQGTSMASPHAAGVAALIRASHPNLPPMAVIAMMQKTAMPMACPGPAERDPGFALLGVDPRCTGNSNPKASGQTNFYGNGLIDALAAGTR